MGEIQKLLLQKTQADLSETQVAGTRDKAIFDVVKDYKRIYEKLQDSKYGVVSSLVQQGEVDILLQMKSIVDRFNPKTPKNKCKLVYSSPDPRPRTIFQ
eukprot:174424-Hanusia_phi.AAC.3